MLTDRSPKKAALLAEFRQSDGLGTLPSSLGIVV
jgi:hypothetical protein